MIILNSFYKFSEILDEKTQTCDGSRPVYGELLHHQDAHVLQLQNPAIR